MKLDLSVMLTVLLGSAVLQELTPTLGGCIVKWPLLTAMVAYYAIHRERAAALTAALWSGVLMDVIDGLPLACTAGYLITLVFAIRRVREMLIAQTLWQGVITLSLAAPLQLLWQALLGDVLSSGWTFHGLLIGMALAVPCGAASAIVVFSAVGTLDRLAGNRKGLTETYGTSWSQCT